MMDAVGIDAAFLTCPPGMCAGNDLSRYRRRQDQGSRAQLSRALHRRRSRQPAGWPRRPAGAGAMLGRARVPRRRDHIRDRWGLSRQPRARSVLERSLSARDVRLYTSGTHAQILPSLNAYDMARAVGREFSLIAASDPADRFSACWTVIRICSCTCLISAAASQPCWDAYASFRIVSSSARPDIPCTASSRKKTSITI